MSYIDDIYDRIDLLNYQIEILNRNYSNLIRRNSFYDDYSNSLYSNNYEDILTNILLERYRRPINN